MHLKSTLTRSAVATLALTAALTTGCGEATSGDEAAAPQTITQTVSDVVTETTATTVTTPAATPKRRSTSTSAAPAKPDCIVVPDVVGGDHQGAQDAMQAAGLYRLDEEDATGQGRMLILDRNWTVVSQKPSAGACVSEDTTILLRSKKDDE